MLVQKKDAPLNELQQKQQHVAQQLILRNCRLFHARPQETENRFLPQQYKKLHGGSNTNIPNCTTKHTNSKHSLWQ